MTTKTCDCDLVAGFVLPVLEAQQRFAGKVDCPCGGKRFLDVSVASALEVLTHQNARLRAELAAANEKIAEMQPKEAK